MGGKRCDQDGAIDSRAGIHFLRGSISLPVASIVVHPTKLNMKMEKTKKERKLKIDCMFPMLF